MKRNLITGTVVILACSSIFFLFSCTKKQVLTVEKETKAPTTEAAKVEKERTVTKDQQQAESKEAERVRTATLEALEVAKKGEAEANAWQERAAVKFEAESIYFDFDKSSIRKEYR
ncbi:MAG: hypothetical protein JRF50_15015, partial [Deltaproteobacteria bacterium]|nr:hypothetical protein [Deltaproteobacteria bacterium]